jgi:hypothetical protein
MEITLTITLPDFRPDIADFARQHGLTVYYGEYIYEDETEVEDSDFALLVSVGHFDWEGREDAEALQQELFALIGEEEIDLYTGNEYWVVFADQEPLTACVEQFGQRIQELFPDVKFERVEFME